MHKSYVRKAFPKDEDPNFIDLAIELASTLRHTIFLDQPETLTVTKKSALQLLNCHIMDNIVKIGNDYYRQVVGIPQGSVLSSLLCSFFYGDLERQFGSYTDSPDSTLFRVIDDYLLVTTNLAKARSFLDMMNQGHPEYGCFISKDKTMTNFDYDHQIMNVVDQRARHFHWCGYAIDMKDLSISVDYTRYHGINLSSTLTITRGRKPGLGFVRKMLKLAKTRCHVIYTDPALNRKSVIYLNIYQNFLVAAMKMHCYLREWPPGWHEQRTSLVCRTVQKMIIGLMHSQARRLSGDDDDDDDDGFVRKVVTWLGYHAFHEILSRKPARYGVIIGWLKSQLNNPRYRGCEKRFRALVHEGLLGVTNVVY
ncbi:Telomerase reverse transcriptase [Leucoagaricus gongylophorus]